jgi:predicted permease
VTRQAARAGLRRALWALLLRAYPRDFRRRHGPELADAVGRAWAELDRGPLVAARFCVGTVLDLLRAAVRLRLHPVQTDRRASEQGPFLRGVDWRTLMSSLAVDFHYGRRALARSPGLAALMVSTIGLGIGLSTAAFSVVHGVLLRPFAYAEPHELVDVSGAYVNDDVVRTGLAGRAYRDISDGVPALESVAAITSIRQNLSGGESPLQVQVGWASRNFFDLLGVRPLFGPGFTPDAPAGTLVLGHGLWQRAFGADEAVLGRSVRLDGRVYTIAGVMPGSLRLYLPSFPREVDVFKVPDDWWQNGDVWSADTPEFGILRVVGRRDEGATLEQVRAQLATVAARYRERQPAMARAGLALNAQPLDEAVLGSARHPLALLSGAVGLVLLIACANVASLLLLRSEGRRREIALRLALGAGRGRIVRFLLAECLLLAAAGGALGVALAVAATRLLSRLPTGGLPRAGEVSVDAPSLAFALTACLASTLLFGLAPAMRASSGDPAAEVLGGRTTLGRRSLRANNVLVVGQLAVSLVLLVGAGLLATSLARLQRVDPGFDHRDTLTFSVSAPGTRYERPLGTDRFFRALEERVRQLPGVRQAGVVWPLPLSGRVWSSNYTAGAVPAAERAYAEYRLATPAYFEAVGIPLRDGRLFRPDDRPGVVIVNQRLAQRAWPEGGAVGRFVRASPWGPPEETFEVVGVVDDVRNAGLREPPADTLYFDSRGWSWTDWEVSFVVRASVPPESLAPAIREQLLRLDPEVPLAEVRPLSALVEAQLVGNRFAAQLIGVFAAAAGALALVGLYGVVSYSVSRRARELGIRVAVGACRRDILALVLGQGARLVAVGVLLGVTASLGLTRTLGPLLFGVSSLEPAVLATVAAGLSLAALGAGLVPARRAASQNPATTLRSE